MSLYSEVRERIEAQWREQERQVIKARSEHYDLWCDLAYGILGAHGRMMSGSKQAPEAKRVVWNANVLADKTKIWYGDISLRDDAKKLQQLADEVGEVIYVLRESDARFSNEVNPLIENAQGEFIPRSWES